MHSKDTDDDVKMVKIIMGFIHKDRPISYLGYPLYIGCQRIIYPTEIEAKVIEQIKRWQTKMLSYEGKATLVKSVL